MNTRLCAVGGQLAVRISDSLQPDDLLDAPWPPAPDVTTDCWLRRDAPCIGQPHRAPEAHRDGAKEVNAVAKC